MTQHNIRTPLLNNNDDSVKVVEWHKALGDSVAVGDVLVTLETTKVAEELESTSAGYLRWRNDAEFATVGDILAIVSDSADEPFSEPGQLATAATGGERHVTLKARALAKQLGVDLDAIEGDRITEQAVKDFAAKAQEPPQPVVAIDLDAMIARAPAGAATVIVGDGAHATYVHDVCMRAGTTYVLGCLSNQRPVGSRVGDMVVVGSDDDLASLRERGVRRALVGVGSSRSGARSNAIRKRIFDKLKSLGFDLPVVVDPDASLSATATIAEGTVVGARAVVSTNVRIGVNCLINVGSILCHDVVIGDHVHVTPGGILAGNVRVGEGSTIGMAATVLDSASIGKDCLVPNGYRVLADLPDGKVAPLV